MIVPDGATLKLDPKDEFNHIPEPVGNYNESVYLDGFDRDANLGFWLRLGNRPNEGYAELSCCVYLPDGRVGFWYGRPAITSNDAMHAGGMHISLVRPFEQLSATYEGELMLLDDPGAMINPGKAFKTAPRKKARITLDICGVSPMHGGEIVNLDGSEYALDPDASAYRGHTEQHISVAGTIQIGSDVHSIQGFGTRDKSWGPRHWQNLFWHKWTPVTFGPDFGVMMVIMGRPGGEPIVTGHVLRDGRLIPLLRAKLETEYDPAGFQRSIEALLETADETLLLKGKVFSAIPLRHRRSMPDGSESLLRIVKAATHFECGGRTTLGMSEFLDVIEDGQPISQLDRRAREWISA